MGSSWYVARTEPRAEFIATKELERDGYDVFLPLIAETAPRPGRTESPLFPGYLFVRCNPEAEQWPTFRSAHRVTGWVRFGNEVPSIPDSNMVELKESLDRINQQGGILRRFATGEVVQVDAGHFQGLGEVLAVGKSPQARANVILQFMGRLVRVQVPWESLRPAEDRPKEIPRLPRRTRGKGRWVGSFRPIPGVTA
ncbi:MAG: hypothetical protein HQ475_09845 [SAR202 cluster bacterium]|nr:hypothetical protein [SAR202 cluster bacterium]